MKKQLFLSLLFLNILFFSCSNLINNGNYGCLSIVMPGSNGRYTDIDQTELPSSYDIKITRYPNFTKEIKAQANGIITIDDLPPAEYEIFISGSTNYYYFEGTASAKVKADEETGVNIKLTKFRKPLYIKSDSISNSPNGTDKEPFRSIKDALTFTGDAQNVAFYMEGTFNNFEIPAIASNLKNLYLKKPIGKANPTIETASSINITSTTYLTDINIKNTTIEVSGSGQLGLGDSTNFKQGASSSLIKLNNNNPIIISSPLTSSFVSNIVISTPDLILGKQLLVPGSNNVNIAEEKNRFTVASESKYQNEFYIDNDGKLRKNKLLKLTLTNTEKGATYYHEIKEGSNIILPRQKYIESAPSLTKVSDKYCFTVGKTYDIYIYKDENEIFKQSITIPDNEDTVINVSIKLRDKYTVQQAIELMTAEPTKKHNMFVQITSNDDFTTLGTGISSNLTSGSVALDLELGSGVTTIPANSFSSCNNKITAVTIPEGITTIGESSFCNSGISTIKLPDSLRTIGNNAFKGTSITELTIPDGVTTINDPGIKTLNILCSHIITGNTTVQTINVRTATSKTSIPNNAYKNCTSLKTVKLPTALTSIGSGVFDGSAVTSLTIPNNVSKLGDNLSSSNITTLTTPANFSYSSNTKLQTVTITGQKAIPEYAYQNCSELKSLTIGSGVSGIGASAFAGCSNLTGKVTIPTSTTTISDNAFSNCSNLDFVLHSGLTIGVKAFLNTGITITEIPANTKIKLEAFGSCSKLGSITIPSTVTLEATDIFKLSSVTSVSIDCSNIPGGTFWKCHKLTSLSIGPNVSKIGNYAFQDLDNTSNHTNLTSVEYRGSTTSTWQSDTRTFTLSPGTTKQNCTNMVDFIHFNSGNKHELNKTN